VTETVSERARELFAPLGPTYDRYARLLSFGQDPRWRRFMVSRLPVGPEDTVVDIACGTGAVVLELVRQTGCSVVGVDQSPEMLAEARRRLADDERVRLVDASAAELPFEDASFDGLTAAYLLRYLDDLPAGLAELARVLRPGASAALLDFWVPPAPVARQAWNFWVDAGLPLAGRAISPGWHEVGRFLGDSIRRFHAEWPLARLLGAFREAGFESPSARRLSLGGCLVLWGRRHERRLDGAHQRAEAAALPAPGAGK
jgi:demethylmenaquinone methyltransferase/2-methoxy-6-polyprenyl-1,4-benzoquinol methylase